ncbi:histidine phosphatase family protein [Nocardioides lianchengensis]|uniref:Broad specificity phosphatase PhoE n=1 Tax=Nocardioides lianchengensis TaxID=1045774 RepID=A0A1G6L456_9ACTN|nr:histidine phosphatase family protein [Nocardioides lianchengensis]NYG12694.1 broad specificity phosphatase PhoE [Nocardioides lianchengensis]SDC37903.1 Broad specificity phosphatase PhoE [Nocardioides lianchengensis]
MGLLLLVRHGQASFGADDYDVLSPTGHEQGRLLGAHLAGLGVRPDAVVRGGMRRHRETAEAMLESSGWGVVPQVDGDWDEFDHVTLVGAMGEELPTDRRAFQDLFERATARWVAGHVHEGGESYDAFLARTRAALDRAVDRARTGTVVVVTSGGPIGAAAASLVDPTDPARLWSAFNTVLVNSSVTRVVVGRSGTRLLTFNEHPHLVGDTLTYR